MNIISKTTSVINNRKINISKKKKKIIHNKNSNISNNFIHKKINNFKIIYIKNVFYINYFKIINFFKNLLKIPTKYNKHKKSTNKNYFKLLNNKSIFYIISNSFTKILHYIIYQKKESIKNAKKNKDFYIKKKKYITDEKNKNKNIRKFTKF